MPIKLIACVDDNYGLGFKQNLLFHIPNDLKLFKELTLNQYVVMGRRTYESLPYTLPSRINVVLTQNKNYKLHDNKVIIEHDVQKIINHYLESGKQSKDIWCIGGSSIYKEFFPYCTEVRLTKVKTRCNKCDTFFPYIYLKDFEISHIETHFSEEYQCEYDFITYTRKDLIH